MNSLAPKKLVDFYTQIDDLIKDMDTAADPQHKSISDFRVTLTHRHQNSPFTTTRAKEPKPVDEPLHFYSTLANLDTVANKENLLKQLDLAINWDTYLREKGNIIDDFQSVISAAEI